MEILEQVLNFFNAFPRLFHQLTRTFVHAPSGLSRGVLGMTPALVQGEGCTELPVGPTQWDAGGQGVLSLKRGWGVRGALHLLVQSLPASQDLGYSLSTVP